MLHIQKIVTAKAKSKKKRKSLKTNKQTNIEEKE